MKRTTQKINIVSALLFLLLAIPATAQNKARMRPLDSTEAHYIAEQLLDSTVRIGTFETAGLQTRLRSLRNGVVPEMEAGYLETFLNYRLTKLNTLQALRGEFDSLIFLQTPTLNTELEEPLQFLPYPDTRWLLLVRGLWSADGKPNDDLAAELQKSKAANYLNAHTLFAVTSEFHGSLTLGWNEGYEPSEAAYAITPAFAKELGRLIALLPSVVKSKGQGPGLASSKWENAGVKLIAGELAKLLLPKPEVKKAPEEKIEGQ